MSPRTRAAILAGAGFLLLCLWGAVCERGTPTADGEGGASHPSAPGVPERAKRTSDVPEPPPLLGLRTPVTHDDSPQPTGPVLSVYFPDFGETSEGGVKLSMGRESGPPLIFPPSGVPQALCEFFRQHPDVEGLQMRIGGKFRGSERMQTIHHQFHEAMVEWCVQNNRTLWISAASCRDSSLYQLVKRTGVRRPILLSENSSK